MRFPEFSGEWKKYKLKDLCSFYSGGTPLSTKKEYYNGNIPFIRSGELHNDSTELCISEDGLNNSSAKKVIKGDLLLALYGATSGDIAISKINGAINQAILCIRTNQNKIFIESVWKKHLSKILKMYLQGGQGNLSSDIVKSLPFYFTEQNEQEKIAHFISLIDLRIATQTKIIDKLKSLIKELSETLLENPTWSKIYLRSFMQFYPTNSLSWDHLSFEEGEIRNLHYGLIHKGQTKGIEISSLPKVLPSKIPKQYTLCQAGDVAFADASEDTNEIGKAVEFIRMNNVKIICGLHTIHGRDVKNKTLPGFKSLAFSSRYFHSQIKRLAQGTKVFSINSSNLLSCYIYIPDMVIQKSIVTLFNTYEELFITNRNLLERYERQKCYLLQRMFI